MDDEDIELIESENRLYVKDDRRGDRKAGISRRSDNWRKTYAGLLPSEMKRLRQLEDENGKLVADLSLDREMLQDVIRRKLRILPGAGKWSFTRDRTGRSAPFPPKLG